MVRQPSVVAQSHVLLLPFFVEPFAAALVQVTLFERDRTAAAQLAGGQTPVFVVLLGRIEQVGSPARFPGGRGRGTGRGQVFDGHGQTVERRRLGHVVVVQRNGQLQRLPVQGRRQVGPEHGLFKRADHAAAVVRGRRAAAAVHGRRRRRGLRETSGPGGRRRQMVVIVRRQSERSGGRRRGRRAPGIRQTVGGYRQPLLDDFLASCGHNT